MSGPIEDPDKWLQAISQTINASIAKAHSAMAEAPPQLAARGVGQDLATFLESFPTDISFPTGSSWLLNHVHGDPELQKQFEILNSFHRALLSALDMFNSYIDYAITFLRSSTEETDTKQFSNKLFETILALEEVCNIADRLPTDVHDPSAVDEFVLDYDERRRELRGFELKLKGLQQ